MELFQIKEAYLMRKLFYQMQSSSCTLCSGGISAYKGTELQKLLLSTDWFPSHILSHNYKQKAKALWWVGRSKGTVAESPQQGQTDVPDPHPGPCRTCPGYTGIE